MIRSELVQIIADDNQHLYQRDVERIVNTVFNEITYSSFTYQGPYHVKKITLDLIALIQQEGYRNISEVIGQHS